MKKFINPRTKTISFENFLRGLKWCETSNTEDKLRGLKLERIFIKGSKIDPNYSFLAAQITCNYTSNIYAIHFRIF